MMSSKYNQHKQIAKFNSWKEECERVLGITFIDWQAFMLFCGSTEEGKAYALTLPREVHGQIVVSGAFIAQSRW
jgi:hypothetical protein